MFISSFKRRKLSGHSHLRSFGGFKRPEFVYFVLDLNQIRGDEHVTAVFSAMTLRPHLLD